MKRSVPALLACLTALLGFTPGQAADPDPASVTIAVPGGDSLQLRIPAGWKHTIGKTQPDVPPTIDLSSPGGVQVKLVMLADPEGRFSKSELVDELVTMANQQYVANAIEKTPNLVRLKVKAGYGAYCTFTDSRLAGVASPGEGEFRNVTSGVYVIGKQATVFAILSNDTKGEEFQRALELVSSGITVAAAGN